MRFPVSQARSGHGPALNFLVDVFVNLLFSPGASCSGGGESRDTSFAITIVGVYSPKYLKFA